MLSFFYKKQKFVMMTVVICLGCAFLACGLHNLVSIFYNSMPLDKEVIFVTATGKKIPKYHLNVLVNFLSQENKDYPEQPEKWNFLNDGIISTFFFRNKAGEEVFNFLNSRIREEWETRFLKEKKFKGYVNSEMPIISTRNVWKNFSASLYTAFNDFINLSEGSNAEAFRKKIVLFLEHRRFPGYLSKQIINYQENHYKCNSDNHYGSFNIFNYENLEDWFGNTFLTALSKIIIEIAEKAKQEGIKVSKKETLSFVQNKTRESFNFLKEKKLMNEVSFDQFYNYYVQKFFLSEKVLCEVLENVLLFKKVVERAGNNFVYDYSFFQDFLKDINQSFEVNMNCFPTELVFDSKKYLNYFETYLDAVGEKRTNVLDLPHKYLEIFEIKKRAPQLVGNSYRLKLAHLDIEELEHRIPLQEVLNWLENQDNITILKEIYPEISISSDNIIENYLSLEPKLKRRMTSFIKGDLLANKSLLIEEKLKEKIEFSSENRYFISDSVYPRLTGIVDVIAFENLLNSHVEQGIFTQDRKNYYLVRKLEKHPNQILTYKECLGFDVLKSLIVNNQEHPNVALVLNKLKEKYGHSLEESKLLLHRLSDALEQYKCEGFQGNLSTQWEPISQRKVVKKSEVSEEEFLLFFKKELLEYSSNTYISQETGPYFYTSVKPIYKETSFDKIFCLQNQVQQELIDNYLLSLIQTILNYKSC